MTRAADWRPQAAALISICLWASAFVGIRAVTREIDPGALALGRLTIGTVVLGVLMLGRGIVRPTLREGALLVLTGVLWFGIYNVALNTAERTLDAGTAAMITNLAPILVMVLAWIFLRERLTTALIAGGLIAFAGIIVIGLSTTARSTSPVGVLLCFLATAAAAAGLVAQKPVLARLPALQVTWTCCLVGALCCAAYAPTLVHDVRRASIANVAGLLYLGVFPTSVAFTSWAYALARIPASRLTMLVYLVPLIAISISWIVLGEVPPAMSVVGGALCLGGVVIARRRPALP
ncbi:MAG: DMT family transporter [Gemmatimonadales bacterium]